MTQPAAAGMTSTSAAPAAVLAASTSSTAAPDTSKTQLQHTLSIPSFKTEQNLHHVAALPAPPPPTSTDASAAVIDTTTGVQLLKSAGQSGNEANAIDRAFQAQEETRRLQFALAQQQVQQYQAMTKQLEAQSGIVMTPCSSISRMATTPTSTAGLAKLSDDLQKRRQAQLAKLQQNVQHQAARAAQAVQTLSNEEWLQSTLALEQEQRSLRCLEQTTKGNTAPSMADQVRTQQQQVIRQHHLVQTMLQNQQEQQQLHRQLKIRLQHGGTDARPSTVAAVPSTTDSKRYPTSTVTSESVKKRKLKSAFDTDLEALAKVCIRVANARTECEMRQALDKLATWLQQCTHVVLLQLAERDYDDALSHRRPLLIQQQRWPIELQVKAAGLTHTIRHLLEAVRLGEQKETAAQEAAAGACSVPLLGSRPTRSSATTIPTVSGPSLASSSELASGQQSPPGHYQRTGLAVERAYAEVKAQLQAKQVEMNQKAKAKRDAAKLEPSTAVAKAPLGSMLDVSSKRPMPLVASEAVHKAPVESRGTVVPASTPRVDHPSFTTTVSPISPRVAQQFYTVDLVPRVCLEKDDKMYLPSKAVAHLMHRALHDMHDTHIVPLGSTRAFGPRVQTHASESSESIHISDDAVTFMQECVTEFLLYGTSEARDLSVLQNRRTKKGFGVSIAGANVVESMDNLGFTPYARVLATYNEKVQASQEAAMQRKLARKRVTHEQWGGKPATDAPATVAAAVSSPSSATGGAPCGAREATGGGHSKLDDCEVNASSTVAGDGLTLVAHTPTEANITEAVAVSRSAVKRGTLSVNEK